MYSTSLYFDIKVTPDKKIILEMFFKDWADRICDNEVRYSTIATSEGGFSHDNETIQVDFVNEEDAVAMKLRGIPDEFRNYLEIVNY
jgi:hypothetical protein